MTEEEFRSSLRSTQSSLQMIGLLRSPQPYRSLSPSDEFVDATRRYQTKYPDLYRIGLRNVDYNFLLADYSFLQFARNVSSSTVPYGLRYAFYPNPFDAPSYEDYCGENDWDMSDPASADLFYQLLDESSWDISVPVVRYEVSFSQYRPLVHPAAHFHIGMHSENRWPTDKILTPLAFSLLVGKLFYPEEWRQENVFSTGDVGLLDRRMLTEKAACEAVPDSHFDENERKLFFFT